MSIAATAVPVRKTATDRVVAYWLIATAVMILLMVVIGGVTRLTESGLSITEWKPVTGTLPPLSEAAWTDAFAKYQQIPEYREIHHGMTLAEFKGIFFWEYAHRLWGRLIGLVALVPLVLFLVQGRIKGADVPFLVAVPFLVGLQGALGWYMVESGLAVRTSVSQYRLTAHLMLAVAIYGYLIWIAADILRREPLWLDGARLRTFRRVARGILALVTLTMIAGGFTAGLKAGLTYNTFPLMDGRIVPEGYLQLDPWWLNLFENIATVQFDHRLLAITTFCAILAFWLAARGQCVPRSVRTPLNLLMLMACIQVALGISTLLLVVPVPLAATHQAGAVLLFTCALLTLHGLKEPRGARKPVQN
ncbi:heme A synthase [Aliidongia dinghuensis]|uniref:Heme A synthase n=1 Tax=Aliidongia dinghuensis TaxID=1867774 RepID=A0A8J2Z187_9PROT|nr:COX15/CtaA family protein [Aliidongia dinghuensis]GGF45937.1 heme A synthase [Aliidongia dinghuensis]